MCLNKNHSHGYQYQNWEMNKQSNQSRNISKTPTSIVFSDIFQFFSKSKGNQNIRGFCTINLCCPNVGFSLCWHSTGDRFGHHFSDLKSNWIFCTALLPILSQSSRIPGFHAQDNHYTSNFKPFPFPSFPLAKPPMWVCLRLGCPSP